MAFKSQKMVHADGKMHHLGTDTADVAPVMILTAGMGEVADIANRLDGPRETGLYREYKTIIGSYNNKPVGVMSSGHGCMPMAIAVEELNHLGVRTIIKLGAGAAMQPDIKPGSFVVPTAAVRGEGATKEYVGYEYPAVADLELVEKLMHTAQAIGEKPFCGICRSHDAFYTEYPETGYGQERIAQWQKLGILLSEHELSSMFVISSILKLRAAAVYVAEENLLDRTSIGAEQLKKRLDICYDLALRVAAAG